jgi:hypothetical protein
MRGFEYMHFCFECKNGYDESFLKKNDDGEYICPRPGCADTLVKIDENMIPLIREVINKGYTTKYCCSGHHFNHPNIYIMLEGYWRRDDLNLPMCLDTDYSCMITHTYFSHHREKSFISYHDVQIENEQLHHIDPETARILNTEDEETVYLNGSEVGDIFTCIRMADRLRQDLFSEMDRLLYMYRGLEEFTRWIYTLLPKNEKKDE